MSLSNDQIEDRILSIETLLTDIQTAINALATKQQLKQMMLVNAQVDNTNTDWETRVEAIEELLTSMQTAINALATKQQLKQTLLVRESAQKDLEDRVTSLENEIAVLQ